MSHQINPESDGFMSNTRKQQVGDDEFRESYDIALSEGVDDEAEKHSVDNIRFNTSFFGADYPVETIVQRMDKLDFFVPPFQRSYVWSQKQASRFIESLLYGLPVPGVFLYKEPGSGRHLIIDGQQRLKSLQFFHSGNFGEKRFRLLDVAAPWNGRSYEELDQRDRLRLGDAIIHATIFKQEEPIKNDQSIYYVFERINTGGTRLSGQEIRTCIYHGEFVNALRRLNDNKEWRKIYGPKSRRLKDQELVLRFLAFADDRKAYRRPMSSFLNEFMEKHRDANSQVLGRFEQSFTQTIDLVFQILGDKAFRPERSLNAAVFDSVMIGIYTRLESGPIEKKNEIPLAYRALLQDEQYKHAFRRATADEESVSTRMRMAVAAFSNVI